MSSGHSGATRSRASGPHTPTQQVAAGDVAHRHAAVVRQMAGQPVQVERPVGADLEHASSDKPRDSEIASDTAGLVEQQRVGHRPDRLVDVVGGHPLQECSRTGSGDLVPGQRGHVVHGDRASGSTAPRPPRSGDQKRDDQSSRSGITNPRAMLSHQIRHWPRTRRVAPSRRPRRSRRRVPGDGRGTGWCAARAGRSRNWWGWTMSYTSTNAWELVCMTNFGLRATSSNRYRSHSCTSIGRRPVDDPLGRGLGHPRGVRHPHGLGDPEARQLTVLPHDRHSHPG